MSGNMAVRLVVVALLIAAAWMAGHRAKDGRDNLPMLVVFVAYLAGILHGYAILWGER